MADSTPITVQELNAAIQARYGCDPMRMAMDRHGITMDSLARKLAQELKAKKTERVKVKGAVNKADLPRGRRVIATSGVIIHGKDGEDYGDGDTVIEWDEVLWPIRQQARIDAQKIMGVYPAEKHEVAHKGFSLKITGLHDDEKEPEDGQSQE